MLIEPSESDDSVSIIFNEEDTVVINRDDQLPSWNTIVYDATATNLDSGTLIAPSFHSGSERQNAPAVTTTENDGTNNLATALYVPASIPTSVILEGNLSISLNGDPEEDAQCIVGDEEKRQTRPFQNFVVNFRHVVVFFISLVLASMLYITLERLQWNERTTKLEKTIRELQMAEQRTAKLHEEQAVFLSEVLGQLQKEEKERQLEKDKADALELEVLRLKNEISDLGKNSQRARELEENLAQLRRDAERYMPEVECNANLEQEARELPKERIKSRSSSSESRKPNFLWDSLGDSTTRLLDNCWLQTDVRLELGECGRRTRESVGQQIKDWGDTILNTQERVKMWMAQDYADLKEMFQSRREANHENENIKKENMESEPITNEKADRLEALNKMWSDFSDTLSSATVRVTEQMAHDYKDVMEFFSGSVVTDESKIDTEERPTTTSDQSNKVDSDEQNKEAGADEMERNENDEPNRFGVVAHAAKSVLYGLAYASIGTVAADYASTWLSSRIRNVESDK